MTYELKEHHVIQDSITHALFTNLDGCLYRSDDMGSNWVHVADADKWTIAKDSKGMIHWAWVESEGTYEVKP